MLCARSPLTRLKAFTFFTKVTVTREMCASLKIALCCTLCCTDVAPRCTETPRFLLRRCPLQGLVKPLREEPCPTQGTRWVQPLAEAFTRLHFCVWKQRLVLCRGKVPSGSEQLSSFIMIKHTHGGSKSSNRSVSGVVCTAFNLRQVLLGPCSATAAKDGNFECSESFWCVSGFLFWASKYGAKSHGGARPRQELEGY